VAYRRFHDISGISSAFVIGWLWAKSVDARIGGE